MPSRLLVNFDLNSSDASAPQNVSIVKKVKNGKQKQSVKRAERQIINPRCRTRTDRKVTKRLVLEFLVQVG